MYDDWLKQVRDCVRTLAPIFALRLDEAHSRACYEAGMSPFDAACVLVLDFEPEEV
jgi:hypothetical protein